MTEAAVAAAAAATAAPLFLLTLLSPSLRVVHVRLRRLISSRSHRFLETEEDMRGPAAEPSFDLPPGVTVVKGD